MSNVAKLEDLFGSKFVNGGRGKGKYDCWGLTMEVYKRFGIIIPDFKISCFNSSLISEQVSSQQKNNTNWEKLEIPESPCVVVMRTDPDKPSFASHIGTYIGNNKFIHTMLKTGVIVSDLDDFLWKRQIMGFYKWIS